MSFTQKHKIPCMENVVLGTKYTLTINPSEQYFTKYLRHDMVTKGLLELFASTRSCAGHVFLELSPHGRIHYHGTIEILDPFDFYSFFVHRLEEHGTIEIDTIEKADVWDTYCKKQLAYMKCKKGYVLKYLDKFDHLKDIPDWFHQKEERAVSALESNILSREAPQSPKGAPKEVRVPQGADTSVSKSEVEGSLSPHAKRRKEPVPRKNKKLK